MTLSGPKRGGRLGLGRHPELVSGSSRMRVVPVENWILKQVQDDGGGSIVDLENRPRGRPRTGESPMKGVRIPIELEAKIAAWIDGQPGPKPSRSEAIRRLIERGLKPN